MGADVPRAEVIGWKRSPRVALVILSSVGIIGVWVVGSRLLAIYQVAKLLKGSDSTIYPERIEKLAREVDAVRRSGNWSSITEAVACPGYLPIDLVEEAFERDAFRLCNPTTAHTFNQKEDEGGELGVMHYYQATFQCADGTNMRMALANAPKVSCGPANIGLVLSSVNSDRKPYTLFSAPQVFESRVREEEEKHSSVHFDDAEAAKVAERSVARFLDPATEETAFCPKASINIPGANIPAMNPPSEFPELTGCQNPKVEGKAWRPNPGSSPFVLAYATCEDGRQFRFELWNPFRNAHCAPDQAFHLASILETKPKDHIVYDQLVSVIEQNQHR